MTHDLRIAPRHSTALKYTKTVLHGMFLYRGKYFIYLNFPTKDFTGSLTDVFHTCKLQFPRVLP